MGDKWLELRRQVLISGDTGDTLSRRFRLRLPTSFSSTSSTLSPFSLLSWPLMLIPQFLHVSCLGLSNCCCRSNLLAAAPRSRSWSLVLLLQFGEVRLTPCLQRSCRVRKESACFCRTNKNRRLSRTTSVPSASPRGSLEWSSEL